jgi:pyruvate dehydrogenase E2 component (dihydrolipoamide acetyltransferase)
MTGHIHPITIPKWGLTMIEGTLVNWRVAKGDVVAPGSIIAEIETSKIVNELEAHVGGTIRHIVAKGATLPVGAFIGVIADDDVTDMEISNYLLASGGKDTATEPIAPAAVKAVQAASTQTNSLRKASQDMVIPGRLAGGAVARNAEVLATSQALKLANRHGIDLAKILGSGRRQRISKADILAAIVAAGGQIGGSRAGILASTTPPSAARVTPLAARLAGVMGIDLASIKPTGSRSRIRRADVEAAARDQRQRTAQNPPGPKPAPLPVALPLVARPDEQFVDTALTTMRKVIADRLAYSKHTAPHFRVSAEIEIDALMSLRNSLNAVEGAEVVSLNDILLKAVAHTLVGVPEVNIQFDGHIVRQFEDAHISLAVALDKGLVAPVVRHANRKGLRQISRETKDFVARAKSGQLTPEEFEGGSFSLSNLGMFGVTQFDAIINPPQGAILAVGTGLRRAVIDAAGIQRQAIMMNATLSADHRVIDGATAAKFMQKLKSIIECPLTMVV